MAESSPSSTKARKTRKQSIEHTPPWMSSSSGPLTEELQCSICLDVFTDPVTTPCGHNFCKTCLNKCWDNSQTCNCPYCKETFNRRPDLKINTTLREVVDHYKKKRPEKKTEVLKNPEVLCDVCEERKQEALKSCLGCQSSYCETHLEPHLRVTQLIKTQKDVQQMIQDRTKKIQDVKHSAEVRKRNTEKEKAAHVELFTDLICSIERCLTELLEMMEEQQKAAEKQEEELIEELEQEITELKMRNTELEQLSHTEDHLHLLQIYSSLCSSRNTRNWSEISVKTDESMETLRRALTRLQDTLQEKLTLTVSTDLKRMQQYEVDVTLDPDTAHPQLILSDDGKQVRHEHIEQKLPNNLERFDPCVGVLGKEGFSSGRFYFEVQVKGKTDWALGVAREYINRKGKITLRPSVGFWTVALSSGNEYWACDDPSVSLCLRVKPQRVGVFVDYEEGLVSFYDVESRSHIYSYTGQYFTGNLYPFFSPEPNNRGKNSTPLIITPVKYNK
ncbi:zinc finger protein RFP-like isoform X2 [Chanodichthys erythropterus]|uniref:zinc finger protein RFP-like isoform X2 n=1 Tax=Chanodichthys erythropterus TaxID=933992 RepID=UPI00351EB569